MENLSIECPYVLEIFFCGNTVLQIYKISYTLIEPWSAVLELFNIAWSSPGLFLRNLSRFIQHLSGQVEKRISRQIVDRGGIDRESDVKKISRCLLSGFKLLHEVCLYKVLLQFFKNKLEKTCQWGYLIIRLMKTHCRCPTLL